MSVQKWTEEEDAFLRKTDDGVLLNWEIAARFEATFPGRRTSDAVVGHLRSLRATTREERAEEASKSAAPLADAIGRIEALLQPGVQVGDDAIVLVKRSDLNTVLGAARTVVSILTRDR